MKACIKIYSLFLVLFLCLVMCSCSRAVTNNADELLSHNWEAQLDNGNTITLSFDMDDAVLLLTCADETKVNIEGMCELSNTSFVIHDSDTFSAYKFDYIVHFDSVDITYGDTTVSLNKIS